MGPECALVLVVLLVSSSVGLGGLLIWILAAAADFELVLNVGLQPCVLFFLEGQIVVGRLLN